MNENEIVKTTKPGALSKAKRWILFGIALIFATSAPLLSWLANAPDYVGATFATIAFICLMGAVLVD